MNTVSAKETCNAMLRIFSRVGLPRVLSSDNGSNFSSAMFVEMHRLLGVELRTSTPFHSETQGLIERWQ